MKTIIKATMLVIIIPILIIAVLMFILRTICIIFIILPWDIAKELAVPFGIKIKEWSDNLTDI